MFHVIILTNVVEKPPRFNFLSILRFVLFDLETRFNLCACVTYWCKDTREARSENSWPESQRAELSKLVIVDTTAAPALYIVGQ